VSDLPELLLSWEKHLRAEGKSKATVKAYGDGIRSYIKGSEHAGVTGLAQEDVVAFPAHLMDTGSASPREKLLRQGRTKPCNQREWATFVAEPAGSTAASRGSLCPRN
jgi:hypothetical protein